MVFNSFEYGILLFLTVLWCLAFRGQVARWGILISSIVFYGWWEPKDLFLLALYVFSSWAGALLLARWKSKPLLFVVLASQLAVLLYYKYFIFTLKNLQQVSAFFGHPINLGFPNIILPIGISFMTFHAMAYVIDVYRDEVAAERSLFDVALFISFFPQLVAGPIGRAHQLMPELKNGPLNIWRNGEFGKGIFMIFKGLIFKIVIADNLSTFVDQVYSNLQNETSINSMVATYFYSLQIYSDFYGYTMMALGSAILMGVTMVNNFEHPYAASNIQIFWNRWHISLSRWFRDYVYIPLGGNRISSLRTAANLCLIMLLVGIWHGANWTFVVWGLIHAFALAGHRLLTPLLTRLRQRVPAWPWNAMSWLLTFHFVTFAWIPFRAPNLEMAGLMFSKNIQFFLRQGPRGLSPIKYELLIVLIFIVIEGIDLKWRPDERVPQLSTFAYGCLILALAALTYLGPFKDVVFLYFQF